MLKDKTIFYQRTYKINIDNTIAVNPNIYSLYTFDIAEKGEECFSYKTLPLPEFPPHSIQQ
jgi:hypothetical protein